MAKSALVIGERISQIVDRGSEFEIASTFLWVEVPDDTTIFDKYINGSVVKTKMQTQEEIENEEREQTKRQFETNRALKAVVLWVAQINNIPPAQARNQVLEIYDSLG